MTSVPYLRIKPHIIITDFIQNTKRKLYDVKLEHALEMLDLEWIKHDNTKAQCNWLNTGPSPLDLQHKWSSMVH